MSEPTTREVLYDLMKVLTDPKYALEHPVEPAYYADPWPVVRTAVALVAMRARDSARQLEAARDELEKLRKAIQ